MKTSLSLYGLIAIAAGMSSLAACSGGTDDGPMPLTGGAAGVGGTANSGGAGNATGSGGDGAGTGGALSNSLFAGAGTWIDATTNTVGVQGAFFILEDSVKNSEPVTDTLTHTDFVADSGGTDVDGVSTFDDTTLKPCISGTAVQVTDETGATGCDAAGPETEPGACQWSLQWGGGIGLNMNETGGEDSTQGVWDALAAGVTGFTFTVSGDAGGATLRFKAKNEGSDEDFCKSFTIVPGTPVNIALSELQHQCWGTTGTQVLSLTNISQLQWQVVTDAAASHDVASLCIENLAWY